MHSGSAPEGNESPTAAQGDAVTAELQRWAAGEPNAGDLVFPLVYRELRTIAHRQRRRWPGQHSLETTDLVNEAYLRLAGAHGLVIRDRAHFFALVSRTIRQVISNYARRAHAAKRGAGDVPVSLDEAHVAPHDGDDTLVARVLVVEDALAALARIHPRPCQVVECRIFGGLTVPETAEALGLSEATVKRDWVTAQAWLHRALAHPESRA
ncbi:MAG: ECF-type sigma factor [Gemmatimonadaceae bacterium]|jgi:RNA polymerase sigma factor (TIGR02999 family)|nr:ECF-type sigma factor [Gemmatimonadaceae bacterium]